ncbi:type IV secretory system conjugative DNA transfer family protein [Streptomyces sp. NPDC101165]|uniref:type IV secretory system conjugative DNA transfer family protein n=1 Tax=Streptomyces sp. NPDC101165 TaxID=3366119 RepID=UPI0038138D62
MNDFLLNRKWCDEHPDFLVRFLDTLPLNKVSSAIFEHARQIRTEEERKSTRELFGLGTVLILYVDTRQKAEKAGTFELKPPLPDEELPPYLRKRVPCFQHCGRTFRTANLTLPTTTGGIVAPPATPRITACDDSRRKSRDCARAECSACNELYRPPDFLAGKVHEAITEGRYSGSQRAFLERWLRLLEEEQVEERAIAAVTTEPVVLGRDLTTNQQITVSGEELCSGTYVLGTQGAGKSSLLEHIALRRLEQGDSVMVIDPHGQLVDNVIARMPKDRSQDTYLLDLTDARHFPFHLNLFNCVEPADETERARTRGRVLRVFRRIWPEIETGQYAEKILRHVTNTLIYHPECTLADVPGWFRTPEAVAPALREIQDGYTRAFWEHDLLSLSARERSIQTEPFLNRLGRLLSDDLLRRLLCCPGPLLDVTKLVQQRRSLLVKLPVDADITGEAASLVGVALFSLIYATTFDERDKDWRDSYTLIVDEFQNFVTSDFVKLFVGGRKYGAKLVLAHQYMNQLDQPGLDVNRRGVLTARNIVCFHSTPHDAVEVAPGAYPRTRSRPHATGGHAAFARPG